MELTVGSTALVVVDMQNAFLHPEGTSAKMGLNYEALRAALPGTERLVERAREVSLPIIFTRYAYRPDYSDGGILIQEIMPALREAGSLRAGTWDVEVVEELKPLPTELVIDKNRPSAFYGTPLESYLTSMGIRSLIVCGVTTNMCVESTVRDAAHRDYRVWVAEDATGEMESDRQSVSLKAMAWLFGRVVSVQQAIESMPKLAGKA